MQITKENLINEFGMKEREDIFFPLSKQINEEVEICVTTINNKPELCIKTPTGILYITPRNIKELAVIENCITGFEELE